MKTKLSYKSKRTIMITVIIIALIALVSTASYFFVKGNKDTTAAFTENNVQLEEGKQSEQIDSQGEAENTQNATIENQENNNEVKESEEGEETSTSANEQTGTTLNTENSTTSGETTGNVPNEEYVTERIEEKEVLVSENYAVEWSPLTIEATTTTADLSVIRPIISQSKTADKTAVVENDIITYTIKVENSGTRNGMALVKDNMPITSKLVNFIDGSIKINGTDIIKVGDRKIDIDNQEIAKLTAEDLSNGIEVNVAKAKVEDTAIINGLVTISFQVQVKEDVEGTIINQAIVNDKETNEVTIPILTYNKDVDVKLIKFDESNQIIEGKELEYTITVTNTQKIKGSVIVKDSVPEGTKFVERSTKITGIDTIKIGEQEIEVSNQEIEKLTETNLQEGIEVEVPAEGNVTIKFKVTVTDTSKTIKNTAYVNEQPTNEVETKIEAHIVFIEHGGSEVDDMNGYAGETINNRVMPSTTRPGYKFEGWYTEETQGILVEQLPEAYPAGTTYYHAYWTPRNDTKYIVEYYYQKTNGTYPTKADKTSELRNGITDTTVKVTDADKVPEEVTGKTYVFANEHELNKLEGKVDPVTQLVLKVYFKLQFTVIYNDGVEGEEVFVDRKTESLDYGVETPQFGPNNEEPKRAGFEFKGWKEEPAKTVTQDAIYIAKWEGLEVTKTRTSIVDVDKVTGRTFVDQVGDIIKYDITIKNLGNISAPNIVLKDDHDVKVTFVSVNKNVISSSERIVNKGNDLLAGLNIILQPNETITVSVEQTIQQSDLGSNQTINIATATLNEKDYTGQEETDVRVRYSYTIKYLYNGVENTAERINDTALLGTTITLNKPAQKTYNGQSYDYIEYYGIGGVKNGSTQITTGTNVIEIHYGKPDVIISKTATARVNAGDNITYNITVENRGYKGTTITVTDDLVDTTFVSATPDPTTNSNNKNLTWNISLGSATSENAKTTITIVAKSNNNTLDATIVNTAKISGTNKTAQASTLVNGVSVNYNEFKFGQTTEDLNIIFVVDNSSSMNYPAEGYSYAAAPTDNRGCLIAPTDLHKTRLAAAKSAINSFIDTYTNSDVTVLTFNEKIEEGQETTKRIQTLVDIPAHPLLGIDGWIYEDDGDNYTDYFSTVSDPYYYYNKRLKVYDKQKGSDNNNWYTVKYPIQIGPRTIGSTKAGSTWSTSRAGLKNAVNAISIGSERLGLNTRLNPALKMIVDNPASYLSTTRKNIVIIIADGAFNDSDYMYQRNRLVNLTGYWDNGDEIYCVGLGGQGSREYDETSLIALSTTGDFKPGDKASELLTGFTQIYNEASGRKGTVVSQSGSVSITGAPKNIMAPSTDNPIIATDENGTVLFTCTSNPENYGITISGKNITWNANIFAQNQNKKVPSVVNIKYYIPLK